MNHTTRGTRMMRGFAAIAAMLTLLTPPARALWPTDAPVLPNPDRGSRTYVASETELRNVIDNLQAFGNKTIILRTNKTYQLSAPITIGWTNRVPNPQNQTSAITIRGEEDTPYNTIVDCSLTANNGGTGYGFEIYNADDIRFAYLTIRSAPKSNIYIHASSDAALTGVGNDDPDGNQVPRNYDFYFSAIADAGDGNIFAAHGTRNSTVRYSIIGFYGFVPTTGMPVDGKAIGVHVKRATNWTLMHNLFENVFPTTNDGPAGNTNYGIIAWEESVGTNVSYNNFTQCEVAIGFGAEYAQNGSEVADQALDHKQGEIKNNFMFRGIEAPWKQNPPPPMYVDRGDIYGANINGATVCDDTQIILFDSSETIVHHNTIVQENGIAPALEAYGEDTANLDIRGNLLITNHDFELNDGADALGSLEPPVNYKNGDLGMFTDVILNGQNPWGNNAAPLTDLHLTGSAGGVKPAPAAVVDVVDKAPLLNDTILDFDTGRREELADYGADEWGVDQPAKGGGAGGGGGGEDKKTKIRPRKQSGEEYPGALERDDFADLVRRRKAEQAAEEARVEAERDAEGIPDWQDVYRRNKDRSKQDGGGGGGGGGGNNNNDDLRRKTGRGGMTDL